MEKEFKWLKFERYIWNSQVLLSLARVKIGGKEKLISHPFCEYGGPLPLADKINGKTFANDLFAQFERTQLKISFHPKILDYFENLPAMEAERETFIFEGLDKLSILEIWKKLDRNRHRSINIAKEQDFSTSRCKDGIELKVLYNFYVKNLKEHKALPYPFLFFKFFMQSNQAEIMLVKSKESVIGGNIFLFYDKIVHSFLCGFRKSDKKQGAHSLVLWQEMQDAKNKDKTTLDLGGTRKDSGIGDFKSRWGAKSYPIYELKNYTDESGIRKSFLRNVWGYLPVMLIKRLSPYLLKYKL